MSLNTSTSKTTPRHIWMHEVYELAMVSNDDGLRYCGRERLNRWYQDEMPVWMAAQSLKDFVMLGKKAERTERMSPRPGDIIRSTLRKGR